MPVPAHLDPGAHPGEAAGREAAGRHPDQAVERDQRHLRRLRPGHARSAHRRAARPPCAGPAGPRAGAGKISVLQEALTGQFRDHHGYLLRMMLDRVDALTAQVEALTGRIDEAIAPFAHQVAQLDEIPGVGRTGAQEIIAEIGVDMTRFPTAGHLVSWAKFAPRARQSAGKSKPGSTGKGNPWIGGTLGEAGIGAARTKTFLGSRYHRIARRRGKQRALVAVGNSILVIAWHLLGDPAARFADLGPDWHDRLAPIRRKRQLIAELERLSGKKVLLQETAA